jgi:hypothetical protein
LFSPEWQPSIHEQRDCDLVVVLGARRGHSFRVDAALQITNAAHNAKLFLTGGRPVYEISEDLFASEAEAMAFYIKEIRGISTSSFIVDSRARTTLESAMHATLAALDLAAERQRAISVVVVSSAYHLRRSWFIFERAMSDFKPLIKSLRGFKASSYVADWSSISKPEIDLEGADTRYAIGLYVLEYLKLIGGRAAGEF